MRKITEKHNYASLTPSSIERAMAGDLTALRLCVERIVPRAKPNNGIHFELPDGRIDSSDNMLQIANNLTKAVANGEISMEEADKFTEFLRHQRQLISQAEYKKQDEEWEKERGW